MPAFQVKRFLGESILKAEGKSHSIRTRILVPIGIIVAVQFVLLAVGIWGSGLMEQLDAATTKSLQQTVDARTDYLQYDMVNRWCDVDSTVSVLNRIYAKVSGEGVSAKELMSSSPAYTQYLSDAMPEMISMMRKNAVTGVFVVLNTGALPSDSNTELTLPGLYLRDRDPISSYGSDNFDIMLERSPIGLVSQTGLSTDSCWMPMFNMCEKRENECAFFNPYRAACSRPDLGYSDLSYWSKPYILEEDSFSAIAYSVPLIADDGTLYGVLGVELLTDYIQRQLPASELGNGTGSYMIGVCDSQGNLSPILLSAQDYRYTLDTFSGMTLKESGHGGLYDIDLSDSSNYYAYIRELHLYNSNAPYSGDQWALYAIVPKAAVTVLSAQLTKSLVRLLISVLTAALLALILISFSVSRPIARLEQEVKRGTGKINPVKLTRSGITELDSLAEGVERLNSEILRNEAKLSGILEMSSTNLGAFEYNMSTHALFISTGFLRVFGADKEGIVLTGSNFHTFMHGLDDKIVPETLRSHGSRGECVYELEAGDRQLWVRLKTIRKGDVMIGLAEDYSREWKEMRKLEFERDHDALTGILNRRAFHQRIYALFNGGLDIRYAALVMLDLDNLKFINDTCGHDFGDTYIQLAASILSSVCPKKALAARMSGDEFFLFLYGYNSEQEIRNVLGELKAAIHTSHLQLPDGTDTVVRASAGVAWYPKNTTDPDQLIKYADFAMYVGKHSTKGRFVDFDEEVYRKNAYLLQGKESLNRLIEQRQIKYVFQPILAVSDGHIAAYEALMRPQTDSLKTPMDVLTLARQESKLEEIERLTWFEAMDAFVRLCRNGKISENCLVFINSISNQILSEQAADEFVREYREFLPRIVQEHTEEEQSDPILMRKKVMRLNEWNARLALDDYGSGYNGESVLVATKPDYVKIDMEIVRNVDTDVNKQQLISGLVAYAHPRNIRVVAEGVETEAEMRMTVRLGVDFIQGYYVAFPAEEPSEINTAHIACMLEETRRLAE